MKNWFGRGRGSGSQSRGFDSKKQDKGQSINLGDGDHTIETGAGNDRIRADDGNNVIQAGEGRNDIRVDDGNNTITTGSGNDRIRADDGNNVIDAGDGRNDIRVDDGNNTITSGSGNDRIRADDGNNVIDAGDGHNDIRVDDGNNVITTGSGNDRITADDGDNIVDAGDGRNSIHLGRGNHQVTTGAGDDHIHLDDGNHVINAGDGNNRVLLDDGNSTIVTGSGNDRIRADDGNLIIDAGDGHNDIRVDDGEHRITTGSGNDRIRADDGDSIVDAGDGNNSVHLDRGNHQVTTGSGNDHVHLGDGNHVIDAGDGNNQVFLDDGDSSVTTGAGRDWIRADRGDVDVSSGAGNDWIHLGRGDSVVDAAAGNDWVFAGSGNDDVRGGAGHDRVYAGSGDDILRYNMSDNAGFRDVYDGSRGTDTLFLEFTRDEWMTDGVQKDVADFLSHLSNSSGRYGWWNAWRGYSFESIDLTVRGIENLRVSVDGVELNPEDEAVTATDDSAVTADEHAPVAGNVLDNDDVPDLAKRVELVEDVTQGSLTLNVDGTWSYDPGMAFNSLAVGETATQSFVYRVVDADNDSDTATVTLTITGTNDAPTVSAIDAGTIHEDAAALTLDLLATAADVDASDDLDTQSVAVSAADGRIVSFGIDDETGLLTLDPGQFNDLALGESVALTVDYEVTDGNGGVVANAATLTVEGRNDAPVITSAAPSAAIKESDGGDKGKKKKKKGEPATEEHSVDGTITFADDDLSDTHTASFTAEGPGYLGNLSIALDQATKTVGWNFSVLDTDLDFLAEGEVLTQRYTVTVDDGNGGTAAQIVTVTVEGTNDVPTFTSATAPQTITDSGDGDSAADGGALHVSTGQLTFEDKDLTDTHTIETHPLSPGALGSLTATLDQADKTIDWTYNVSDAEIEHLGLGEVSFQTFQIVLIDSQGDEVTRNVTIRVEGSNDAPIVAAIDAGTIHEDQAAFAMDLLSTSRDVDANDDLDTQSVTVSSSDGRAVAFTVYDETGTLILDPAQFNDLAQGQSATLTITYDVTDGNGGVTPNTATLVVEGRNDAPVVSQPVALSVSEEHAAFSVGLLQGASDPDQGSSLSAFGIVEGSGQGGWRVEGNSVVIDPNHFDALNDGEQAVLSLNYQILDEHGAAVAQTLDVTIEGFTDAPSLDVTTAAGDDVNETRLIVTSQPARDERVALSFNDLPAGAIVLNHLGQNVTAGIADYYGTQTFTLIVPEGTGVETDVSASVTGIEPDGEVIGETAQAVDLTYDIATTSTAVNFASAGQSMWGSVATPDIGWHEYIPLIGTADAAWTSGPFNVIDIDINSDVIFEGAMAGFQDAIDWAVGEKKVALDILAQAEADKAFAFLKATHVETVSNAWIDYNAKVVIYTPAKAAYDTAKAAADAAKVNMDADAANLAHQQAVRDNLWDQRVALNEAAHYQADVFHPILDPFHPQFPGYTTRETFVDPIKYLAVTAKDLEIAAKDAEILVVKADAEITKAAYNAAKATQDSLYGPMKAAKDQMDAAHTYANQVEDAMNADGIYYPHTVGPVDVTAAWAEHTALAAHVEATKVPVDAAQLAIDAAQLAYDTAAGAVATLDLSGRAKIDAELSAKVGLQVDFDLDLGSVDTNLDYDLTTESRYNQTTDMLVIAPMMTNLATAESVAFSTMSPNATFTATLLYELGASVETLVDAYANVGGNTLFDLSPDTDGILIQDDISMVGEITLVDFDSSEGGGGEIPFIETLTEDIVSIGVNWPTIETEGKATEFDTSYFQEGGLLNVDFSEISGAFFNFLNAGIDFSPEMKAAFAGLGEIEEGTAAFDAVMSAADTVLSGIWSLINGDADTDGDGAVPVFLLDATDETSTSLLHLNTVPDDLSGIDVNTGKFGFFAAYGESDPVVEVSIDIDQFVSLVANLALGNATGEIYNPLVRDYSIDAILGLVDVPKETADEIKKYVNLGFNYEYADLDASTGWNFKQEFTLSVDDMLHTLILEDGTQMVMSANEADEFLIANASQHDANGDGIIDFDLQIIPEAVFSNDTEVGMSFGYTLDILKAGLEAGINLPLGEILQIPEIPTIPVPMVDIALGPLLRVQGDLDVLDVDLFESRFDMNVGSAILGSSVGAVDDVVEGDAGDNALDGKEGNDVVKGLGGNDILAGGQGTDFLTGGDGNDIFVFGAGDGSDTITDFSTIEDDVIDLQDLDAVASAADALALATQDGADVLFDFGNGDSLVLANTSLSSLNEDDILA